MISYVEVRDHSITSIMACVKLRTVAITSDDDDDDEDDLNNDVRGASDDD